ncbi:sensor histidine kinase [Streptomyces sp. MP131-18]|uniref:sensor histidine kinase n=1 Tax=Streptomyces sp. MP131-18 TaxID=1857892 RepID=UPI00097C8587|nr:sensor histidine kinase [Streptomyces sp. MP131-18]ONK12374.1 Nitrate/nitrite sensor protein NarX [Streptomyces sp. MP131-18]
MGVELLLTVAVGCVTAADLASNVPGSREDDWISWALLAVTVLGLLAHRRKPLLAAVVTGAASLTWTLYGHIGELLNLPVMVALYFVAVQGDRRRTLRVAVVGALLSGAAAVISGQEEGAVPSPVLEMLIPLVPLLLGEVVRGRHELARRAEVEHRHETTRRLREERVRIARELHDVVAHTVSAMTVQAGVALDAFDRRPEVARAALQQVRDSGKEAVRELRTTVTILRENDTDAPAAPAPRLAQLAELTERLPLPVTLHLAAGPPSAGPLPPVVELTAYRIVQEALTNVVKHSNARHAAVSVRAADGRLLVEVTDDGPGGAHAGGGTGFGLLGMRERATAVGGSLEYGVVPGGGFRVSASLPAASLWSAARGAA